VSAGPARVLDALRRGGGRPCSGETLSREHGISRAQVWKDVETLRARGYGIDAEPGGGYRLVATPDRLYPEELQHDLSTRWLARTLRYFDETDSTNRVALDWAREDAPHGATIVAEAQTAGRGRLGRSFHSPAYLNLYTSIVLRPVITLPEAAAWILAAAVGVADSVAETLGDDDAVEIKWPNDVLIDGRKTCGILMELGAEATRVAFLVVGIGVNLNVDPSSFPDEFRARATSLAEHRGAPIDRVAFTQTLFGHLETVFDACAASGIHGILPRFEARFGMRGQRVRIREHDGTEREGLVAGIDTDGALQLEVDGGRVERWLAGDVTLVKEPG
jgi:BirA family biotin operon repressor/biotin-[acetyl-CoA-carboxylase] ligase